MAMARKSMVQHPNPGNEGGSLLQCGKITSSESSASEKAEDTGGRGNGLAHHTRTSSAHPGALTHFIPVMQHAVDDSVLDYDSGYDYASTSSFEFHKGDRGGFKPVVAPYLNKVAPSKWDEAEKWLVSQSPSEAPAKPRTKSGPLYGPGIANTTKRAVVPIQPEWQSHFQSIRNEKQHTTNASGPHGAEALSGSHHNNVESMSACHPDQGFDIPGEWTKMMDSARVPGSGPGGVTNFAFIPVPSPKSKGRPNDCYPVGDEPDDMKEVGVSHEDDHDDLFLKPMLRTRKPTSDSVVSASPYVMPAPAVRSVSMRDMGTEMTPIASQEPSRTGTPIRATTPTVRSPVSSCSSTPGGASPAASPTRESEDASEPETDHRTLEPGDQEMHVKAGRERHVLNTQLGKVNITSWASKEEEDADASKSLKNIDLEEVKKNVLETRAAAWEEAEKAKYLARFKREEAKIQAWENHEKAKAEAELRRIEVKVERTRSHAHEKLMNKVAAARRKAEERRATAEAKKCEQAAKTAERADYIRSTGRVPSSFFSCGLCR